MCNCNYQDACSYIMDVIFSEWYTTVVIAGKKNIKTVIEISDGILIFHLIKLKSGYIVEDTVSISNLVKSF